MKRTFSLVLGLLLWAVAPAVHATERLVGGDLSLVPAYEAAGDKWLDEQGSTIPDLIAYVKAKGWNTVRVRLFLDPTQDSDPSTCQDYAYVLALALRVKEAGMKFMLDFHYSDTWADPSTQKIPVAWSTDTSAQALARQLYDYTYGIIADLIRQGAAPDLVQLGNEITYGLLWTTTDGKYPTNSSQYATVGYCPTWNSTFSAGTTQWRRTASFLNNAAHAVHQGYADAGLDSTQVRLIVHTEMGGSAYNSDNFYRHLRTAGFTNYDVIGLSYYPFWHGKLTVLGTLLNTLLKDFPEKEVQIVETAWYNNYYPYTSDATNEYTIASLNSRWTASAAGMVNYLTDLVAYLDSYDHVTGIIYWAPEECGNGYQKTVMRGWINRGMWQNGSSRTHAILKSGTATPVTALAAYAKGGDGVAAPVAQEEAVPSGIYDLAGRSLPSVPRRPGVYIREGRLTAVQ